MLAYSLSECFKLKRIGCNFGIPHPLLNITMRQTTRIGCNSTEEHKLKSLSATKYRKEQRG